MSEAIQDLASIDRILPVSIDSSLPDPILHPQLCSVVRSLLPHSHWSVAPDENILMKRLSGGLSNIIICLTLGMEHDTGPEERVVVRLYGSGTVDFADRDTENLVCHTLSCQGLAAQYIGRFQNGRVESFLKARSLVASEVTSPLFYPAIATIAARLHCLCIPGLAIDEQHQWKLTKKMFALASKRQELVLEPEGGQEEAVAMRTLTRLHKAYEELHLAVCVWRDSISGAFQKACGTQSLEYKDSVSDAPPADAHLEQIDVGLAATEPAARAAAAAAAAATTTTLTSNDLEAAGADFALQTCFCHGDFFCGNIMTREPDNTGGMAAVGAPAPAGSSTAQPPESTVISASSLPDPSLVLIDFEYSAYNMRALDLAHLLLECVTFDVDLSLLPQQEFRLTFLSSYLRATYERQRQTQSHEHQNERCDVLPWAMVEEKSVALGMDTAVRVLMLALNLFWAAWAVIQAQQTNGIDFNYWKYALLRAKAFDVLLAQWKSTLPEPFRKMSVQEV